MNTEHTTFTSPPFDPAVDLDPPTADELREWESAADRDARFVRGEYDDPLDVLRRLHKEEPEVWARQVYGA